MESTNNVLTISGTLWWMKCLLGDLIHPRTFRQAHKPHFMLAVKDGQPTPCLIRPVCSLGPQEESILFASRFLVRFPSHQGRWTFAPQMVGGLQRPSAARDSCFPHSCHHPKGGKQTLLYLKRYFIMLSRRSINLSRKPLCPVRNPTTFFPLQAVELLTLQLGGVMQHRDNRESQAVCWVYISAVLLTS